MRLMFFHETGESRRFAFVGFADEESGENAMREYSGREIHGRILNIEKSYGKDDLALFELVSTTKKLTI